MKLTIYDLNGGYKNHLFENECRMAESKKLPLHKNAELEAYQARIEQLEKKLETLGESKTQSSTVSVSVSDMNDMYSNHLATIDLILGVAAFFIIAVGGFFGWLGYTNIKNMVQNKVNGIVGDLKWSTQHFTLT